MSVAMNAKTAIPAGLDPSVLARVIAEQSALAAGVAEGSSGAGARIR